MDNRFIVIVLFFVSTIGEARELEPWLRFQWLNLYQYKSSYFGKHNSEIKSKSYFFSQEGPSSPKKEYESAIFAFQDTKKKWGTQNQPAACVFPARKKILEKLSNIIFPNVSCPDLVDWKERIDAHYVSVVFAGAYGGNPASILGHTFFRFYSKKKEELGDNLLSYSVGFLANPDPSDNRITYVLRGLFGGYPGFYQIEAHYIKVGLYNNAESRDLWEWPLNLSKNEVELFVEHFWELIFNAQSPYYFLDENCSYRITRALGVLRELKEMDMVVIPSETIRLLQDGDLTSGSVGFRPSVLRRMYFKIDHMNQPQIDSFYLAMKDPLLLKENNDPLVLDALIDYWMHRNFKKQTHLDLQESDLMEQTLKKRASLVANSTLGESSQAIQSYYQLAPITEGHRPKMISALGNPNSSNGSFTLSYRQGLHPEWMSSQGYDNIQMVEFLGFDLTKKLNTTTYFERELDWRLLLVEIKSLRSLLSNDSGLSWGFSVGLKNTCLVCDLSDKPAIDLEGFGGGAIFLKNTKLYLSPSGKIQLWDHSGFQFAIPIGYQGGIEYEHSNWKVLVLGKQLWFKEKDQLNLDMHFSFFLDKNSTFRIVYSQSRLSTKSGPERFQIGYAKNF